MAVDTNDSAASPVDVVLVLSIVDGRALFCLWSWCDDELGCPSVRGLVAMGPLIPAGGNWITLSLNEIDFPDVFELALEALECSVAAVFAFTIALVFIWAPNEVGSVSVPVLAPVCAYMSMYP